MQAPEYKWPRTAGARGVLFFAQIMREMLAQRTFESFRALALDTVSRLNEASRLLRDIEAQRVKQVTAEPFIAELVWSLERDPVIDNIAGELSLLVRQKAKNKQTPLYELRASIDLLYRRTRLGYQSALETLILEIYSDPNKRIKLRAATGFYCSTILNGGHNREYLKRVVDRTFFFKDMSQAGTRTLKAFFSSVAGQDATFTPYTIVSESFSRPLARLGFPCCDAGDLPAHVRSAFALKPHAPTAKYLYLNVEKPDEEGAVDHLELMLAGIMAINNLGPRNGGYEWESEWFVTRPKAQNGVWVKLDPLSFAGRAGITGTNRTAKAFRATTTRLFTQFDRDSTARLFSSLMSSAVHKGPESASSQLISLWSAIEVLLSDPPPETPRIVHYADILVPTISLRYARRVFVAVYDEMQKIYRSRFNGIIRKEKTCEELDPQTRFAAALIMPGNDSLRSALITLCDGNPLAQHRLFRLHKDFGSPKSFFNSARAHQSRVAWQIYRIYRARNRIVHQGGQPSYLDSLVLNLYEYYRAVIWTMVAHATRDSNDSRLDRVAEEIVLEYEMYMKTLGNRAGESTFTRTEMLRALSVS